MVHLKQIWKSMNFTINEQITIARLNASHVTFLCFPFSNLILLILQFHNFF